MYLKRIAGILACCLFLSVNVFAESNNNQNLKGNPKMSAIEGKEGLFAVL